MKDLTGLRHGVATVVRQVSTNKHGTIWLCQCDCGAEFTAYSGEITRGRKKSCGCVKLSRTHGHSFANGRKTPTYSSWAAMIARCMQPSNPAYGHYKKLDITVCNQWRKFENFLADMGERPSKGHTLDRINNDGNYEPGNVRWATKKEQANNRRTNKLFNYNGATLTFAELVRATGKPKELLRHRLLRANWPLKMALSAPMQQGRRTDIVGIK